MTKRNTQLSSQQKALEINLDDDKYGTFVEIGAGQEVARQFFSAGAAAGTVAKTMSAYDMQISDVIYGKAGAYVSQERLQQMLSREFTLLKDRLSESRPKTTQFFSYAATVTAKSFKQKNECHGWIGILFQPTANAAPSEILMHVRMLDDNNQSQAEALGIIGVNLIYGAFHYAENSSRIIEGLLDTIDSKRIEVDLIHFSGPQFSQVDNRMMNLQLVHNWCCRAAMFDTQGESIVPGSALRKKDILVMRGSFMPPTKVHMDMSTAALNQLESIGNISDRGILNVAEITLSQLASGADHDDASILARIDLLASLGYNVLISDYLRFFRLKSWMRRYTDNRISVVMNMHDLSKIFDDSFYQGLEGGILLAMGMLFSDDTHVFVYPSKINGELITINNVNVKDKFTHLLNYLVANNSLVPTNEFNEENLHILPRNVLKHLRMGRGEWEQSLPPKIAAQIIEKGLLGYKNQ